MVQQANASIKNCTNATSPLESSTAPFIGPWKCNVCGEKFVNPKAHVDHMGTHSGDHKFSCLLCLSRFKTTIDLDSHVCVANSRSKSRGSNANNSSGGGVSAQRVSQVSQPPRQPEIVLTSGNTSSSGSSSTIINVIDSHSQTSSPSVPSECDEDLFDRFENAQNPAHLRSRSSSIETNNNVSEKSSDAFLIGDPWKACSALVILPEETLIEAEENNEPHALPPVLEPMNNIMVTHEGNRKNADQSRNSTAKLKFSRNSSVDSYKSTGSSGKNKMASSRVSIPEPHSPVPPPLLDLWNIVANHEAMCGAPSDTLRAHHDDMFNENDYPPKEMKCVQCMRTFTDFYHWGNHLIFRHCNHTKCVVRIKEIKVHDDVVTYHVRQGVNGEWIHTPKTKRPASDTRSTASTSSTVSVRSDESGLKLTFCRSEGADGYRVKRKSTEGSDNNDSSGEGPRETLRNVGRTSSSGVHHVEEAILPHDIDHPQDEEYNEALEAALEQSRVQKRAQAQISEQRAAVPGERGEEEAGAATSRMGFMPRFMRAIKMTKPLRQNPQNSQPSTSRNASEESPPVVSTGSAKNSIINNPISTPVISAATDHQPPLPNLVSSDSHTPERDTPTDENDNHKESDVSTPAAADKQPTPTTESSSSSSRAGGRKTPGRGGGGDSDREGSSSPTIIFEGDVRNSSNNSETNRDTTVVPKREPAEAPAENVSRTATPATVDAILPHNENLNTELEADNAAGDDEEGSLVIVVPGEAESANGRMESSSNTNNNDNTDKSSSTENTGVEKVVEDSGDKAGGGDGEVSGSSNNDREVVDTGECRVCHIIFTDLDELDEHFRKEHVRFASSTTIFEPESPFPADSGRGHSIFEDEEEQEEEPPESQPQQQAVMRRNSNDNHPHTLSSLLRRDSTEDQRFNENAIIPNYVQQVRGAITYGPGPHYRPMYQGRGMQNIRPHHGMPQQANYAANQVRPGMRPPPSMAPGTSHRMGVPYRTNNYPATLHQALVGQPPSHQAPPPRPQLRPMPGVQMQAGGGGVRGQAPPQVQRPPLTRVPAPVPLNQHQQHQHQQNQQSILISNHQQAQQRSPPYVPPQRDTHQLLHLNQRYQNCEQQIGRLVALHKVETDGVKLEKIRADHEVLKRQQAQIRNQIIEQQRQLQQAQLQHQQQQQAHHHQNQMQQQQQQQQRPQPQSQQQHLQQQLQQVVQQQQLQRQHMQQQQSQQQGLQQQQLQQLRQQQLAVVSQQQQQRALQVAAAAAAADAPAAAVVNANGKRPSIEIFESGVAAASRPKQSRLESMLPSETSISEVRAPTTTSENLPLRLPNGVTLSVLQTEESAPAPQTAHVAAPGLHSGGSTGSRHSSGTTSPATVSPGTVGRLANSGITLTPASPVPISPPSNPMLSPISDSSPRNSPRNLTTTSTSVIQRTPSAVSPMGMATSPVAVAAAPPPATSALQQQPEGNFAVPRAPPVPARPGGVGIAVNPNAERPDRPPTIDLTDDDVQMHNAQMRATGGGVVSQEQIQTHHDNSAQRRAVSIPGTHHFTIRPQVAHQNKGLPCPHCPGQFTTMEALHEHKLKVHGQAFTNGPNNTSQQYFRQPGAPPQVAMRRALPPSQSQPMMNPNNIHGQPRLDARPPVPRLTQPQLAVQSRPANNPQINSRPQEQRSTPSSDRDKFVIPLLNLQRLDSSKMRALNEMGVASFIPVNGSSTFGIPIMRLQSDTTIGHFPHDCAMEIGPVHRFADHVAAIAGSPTSPHNNAVSPVVSGALLPPQHQHQHQQQQQQQGVAAICQSACNDANCPDSIMMMRRLSPAMGGTVHHVGGHGPYVNNNSISVHSNNQVHHQHPQNIQSHGIHQPNVGAHGQLVVTPINRN